MSDVFGRDLIQARLAALRLTPEDYRGEHELNPDFAPDIAERVVREASVLVPLVERPEGLSVLLTRRSDQLQSHAGQVSFPGGRREDTDADAIATALRETEEEVGITSRYIDVAGRLRDYLTGTGYRITPVVGFVTPGFVLRPDPFEVAEIFEVPFAFLMDPRNHSLERVHWRGAMREYYAMPYNGHYIWGATAGMLRNFYETLRGE
ncbi:CoA pyrophosphatase [Govanella unica]|uniref:CoA pyrophosphatase n=1 Tax=Govanella unica TaxID=2975056 RepID=A0A9X3TX01_9PROT|nr:CoA pyrophosphatase [Govania unica]MDA5193149.1 CoA pyrophosphatase [Govania unica]